MNARSTQRGSSLFEALIAFLLLSLGMVAIARLQGQMRLDADVARQRSEAVRLAQLDIETLRHTRPFSAIGDASNTSNLVDAGTAYTIERRVGSSGTAPAKTLSVRVAWVDRSGTDQWLVLDTLLDGTDPALTGALALHAAALASSPP